MKVTTDSCLFGAWVAGRVGSPDAAKLVGMLTVASASGVWSQESLAGSFLDVGTGTGLLSLMIAQQSSANITTVEIDTESFEQASQNIAASPWANRIKVFHADVRRFEFPKQYDVIISNPPFYEKELKTDDAKKNIAHHNEGLLLPELLSIIKKNLKSNGTFYLLLPFKRNEEIRKMLIESDMAIRQLTFVRQSPKHDYFRIMISGKIKNDEAVETKIDEIAIKDENDEYTSDFILLLKDYYLHF